MIRREPEQFGFLLFLMFCNPCGYNQSHQVYSKDGNARSEEYAAARQGVDEVFAALLREDRPFLQRRQRRTEECNACGQYAMREFYGKITMRASS